jgi:transcriptional regulator with PAS, ATPase and Fis domain
MTEPVPAPDPPDAAGRGRADGHFRWQAFFRRAAEPLFLLDRRQRPLFVNAAWEALTGIPAADAPRLVCRRPRPAGADDPPHAAVEHALTPPPEARRGAVTRVRRLLPGRRWWDVDFFPLRQAGKTEGVLILGRITPVAVEEAEPAAPLPERLVALRERVTQRYGPDLLSGDAPALRRLAEQARLAAHTAAPVLLVGEPGTGKETLARFIHYQGPARERPFAALDCARLPAAALADVLFGPSSTSLGAIYLREPSRLPRDLQLRLCGVLRGGAEEVAGSPRILAGCIADPLEEMRAGRLLDELHAALAVLTLHLPPLRERQAELPALVDRLLERCNEEGEPHVKRLAPDVWDVLRAHAWPGNLRELYAVLSAARRRAGGERITAEHLPAPLRLLRRMEGEPGRRPERPLPLDALLEQAERRLIEMALERAGGKKHRAAEILSIWRARLIRRMKALGIGDAEGGESDAE